MGGPREDDMQKLQDSGSIPLERQRCLGCGYVYDPAAGDPASEVPPATMFQDLPDDWSCPDCGASKQDFEPIP